MRLKLGRPDISTYAERFAVPAANDESPLAVTFLGVSTLLIDDGTSAVMTDGFFSRPGLLQLARGRIAPDAGRIAACLTRAQVHKLHAVLPVHTHYDHALDSAFVAQRTDAVVVGGESAANIARGHGLPDDRIVVATPGTPMSFGSYLITMFESHHCPPDRFPGTIDTPVAVRDKTTAYRCGEAWSIFVAHEPSGRRALVQGSAGYVEGALAGQQAEVVYLGIGQLGIQSREYMRTYWNETVRAIGARVAVLTHWDDFFSPLDRPLRALPFAGDDLDATMREFSELAAADGVQLLFPTVWAREDPWRLL